MKTPNICYWKISTRSLFILLIFFLLPIISVTAFASSPVTTGDPDIPLDELEDMLYPMTSDELFIEADAWLMILKKTAEKISKAQLEIKRKNKQIERKEDRIDEGSKRVKKIEKSIDETTEAKFEILDDMTILHTERVERVDRLNTILKAITDKIGKTAENKESEKVIPYRLYIHAVSGVNVDVTDLHAAWIGIYGWVISTEGGLRWLLNFLQFVLVIAVFWLISRGLSQGVGRVLAISPSNSVILNQFIVNSIRRLTFFIGLLIGLSSLEINVGPVLALVGAAGFVVAFALQSTLSNFASGIMIMFYRPFDVGDQIHVEGEYGVVRSMTLVSTSVMTLDNKLMVVPNNTIWGNTIINATKSIRRRIDLTFGISYTDNIERAKQILENILAEHPDVLSNPEPVVRLSELGDSSVNFVCRPWVKTADYLEVRWDITRQVKERFDAEGISIPFPQRDVHVYNQET